jgi:RNA polymerase sigma factor (sigma-70 family)
LSDYSTYSDEQLVALLKESDEQAFDAIYYRYWKRMIALAFAKIKLYEESEDIVHDIFTSLWHRREGVNIQSLENWLAVSVKYKVVNLINRKLKREISTDAVPERVFIDTKAEQHFIDQQVNTMLEQLPERSRIVFQYSRQLGYSNKEIASTLQLAEKTVEKHITAVRRHLSLSLRNLLHFFF